MRATIYSREKSAGHRYLVKLALVFLISIGLQAMGLGTFRVHAQGGEPWASSTVLSQGILNDLGAPARSTGPALAADEWGNVHAVWAALLDEEYGRGTIGDTLYYAVWDSDGWSPSVDILYRPGGVIWLPKVIADSQGWVHLAWMDGAMGQIWYARAPIYRAAEVRAWSRAVPIAPGRVSGFAIASGADGSVHAAYCGLGEYAGVYHVRSTDENDWSTPVFIGDTGSPPPVDYSECRLGLAADARGRLHVIWGQSLGVTAPVYYARSNDGGHNWLSPLEIDRKDEGYSEGYSPGRPNLLAIGADEVHLVWYGAPAGQRWHQWSADGGSTWSVPEQMFADFRGFCEPPVMAVDSSGTLHLVSSGFAAAYHTSWRNGQWSPLTLVEDVSGDEDAGGEFAALAIAGGNMLHVIGDYGGFTQIWASSLEADASSVPPRPRPTTKAGPGTQATGTATATPRPIEGQATERPAVETTAGFAGTIPASRLSSELTLLFAILPSIGLVGLFVLVRRKHGRS